MFLQLFTSLSFADTHCKMNKKKGLFWEYYGPHDMTITSIRKFMNCSDDFIVTGECKKCGTKQEVHFVSYSDLIFIGFKPEELDKINTMGIYFDSEDEFKKKIANCT